MMACRVSVFRAAKDRLAAEHLKGLPKEDVTARRSPRRATRGHVRHGARSFPGSVWTRAEGFDQFARTDSAATAIEVDDLGMAAVGDEDVGGLQIAVHHALLVRRGEALGHLRGQLEAPLQAERAGCQQIGQPLASHQLHGDEGHPLRLVDLVHHRDRRVLQSRRRPRLLHEAAPQVGIGEEVGARTLRATSRSSFRSTAR
jgi:hypothetical protein